MIDLKSQIIFSEDLNATNFKETLQLTKAAHNAGFTDLVTTPRFTYQKDCNSVRKYDLRKCQYLNRYLKENNIDIKVHLGSEIDYSLEISDLIEKKEIPSINDSRYILIKFNKNCDYYTVIEGVFQLQLFGYIAIISQIEQYDFVIANPNIVKSFIQRGVLLQLDILSITGAYGQKVKDTAVFLLKHDMIHILGTNSSKLDHYIKSRSSLRKIQKIVGKSTFENISRTNGSDILNNNLIYPKMPKESTKRRFSFGR